MIEIEYYTKSNGECAILAWYDDLERRSKTDKSSYVLLEKIQECEEILVNIGLVSGLPHIEKIHPILWQLRPKSYRIIFTMLGNNRALFLHYFRKTTKKTPKKEINKALSIFDQYKQEG